MHSYARITSHPHLCPSVSPVAPALTVPAPSPRRQVMATDGGSPAKSSVTRVLLRVLPERPAAPYPPRVLLPSEPVQVYETEPVGHMVKLAAANTTLLFSIAGERGRGEEVRGSPVHVTARSGCFQRRVI